MGRSVSSSPDKEDAKSQDTTFSIGNMPMNFWKTLQIAYYNMAVEYEHLSKYEESLESFKNSLKISKI